MPADLHCHTRLSDGSLGIEDLILLASRSGIDTIAITDHDCQAGTVRGKRTSPSSATSRRTRTVSKACAGKTLWPAGKRLS